MNDLLLVMDKGRVSALTLLDLSAAFDTIDHTTLLHRLRTLYGISGFALAWSEFYLSDRTQCVFVDGHYSKSVPVQLGVPQGSVLEKKKKT